MNKCYYCGSKGRGCVECNQDSRVGGKSEAQNRFEERGLLEPVSKAPAVKAVNDREIMRSYGLDPATGEAKTVVFRTDSHDITLSKPTECTLGDAYPAKQEAPEAGSWEAVLAWFHAIQARVHNINPGIRMELVREPFAIQDVIYARWELKNHPDPSRRHRCQQWTAAHLQQIGGPAEIAKSITDYIKHCPDALAKQLEQLRKDNQNRMLQYLYGTWDNIENEKS